MKGTGIYRHRARGAILIIAMIVLFALASLVLAMGRSARVEAMAAANRNAILEASTTELAAEQFVMGLLATRRDALGAMSESDFAAVRVGNGFFWIIRPNFGDPALPRFGVLDESTKVSLNSTVLGQLKELPRMTDEIAASIVDWRDEDDTAIESGGESAYYLGLPEPHNAKNADFESVDELRLLKGMTDEAYFGAAGLVIGEVSYGLQDSVTVWSRAKNTAADGSIRINVRDRRADPDEIRERLSRRLTQRLGGTRAGDVLQKLPLGRRFEDVFEIAHHAKLTADEIESIENDITSSRGRTLGNRLNINTAPRELLLTLTRRVGRSDIVVPDEDVDTLLAKRPAAVARNPTSIAWVHDALKERSIGLGRRVIGRGDMYSADIVAASGNGRAFKRVKIVVDVSGASPRVVHRHDITDRGFPLDASILTNLRAGITPGGSGGLGGATIGARQ